MPFILLAMLAVPLIEIALFIQVGGRIGLLATIGIVIATALLGSALLRHQGLGTLNAARAAMAENKLPLTQVFDGFCLLIAGAFLLTPGFLTDAIGFLLFLPPVRVVLGRWVWNQLSKRGDIHVSGFNMGGSGGGPQGPSGRGGSGDVVDGEFREVPTVELPDGRPGPPRKPRDG